MTTPRWLQVSWKGCQACGRGCWRLIRWTGWLLLIILAVVQTVVLVKRELHVPPFVLRELERQMAEAGLQAEFGDVTLDPAGRLLLNHVEIRNESMETRIARARAIYLEVDPWALGMREFELQQIELMGVDFYLPAALSPTGAEEPILRNFHAIVQPGSSRQTLEVVQANAQVGPLPFTARGEFAIPPSRSRAEEPRDTVLERISASYFRLCRQIATVLPRLPDLTHPHLDLQLRDVGNRTTQVDAVLLVDQVLTAPFDKFPDGVRAESVDVRTSITTGEAPQLRPVSFSLEELQLANDATARFVDGNIEVGLEPTEIGPRLGELRVNLGSIEHPLVTLNSASVTTNLAALPVVQVDLSTWWYDEPWALAADLDVTTGAGVVEATGEVDAAVRDWLGELVKVDVPALLVWDESPYLTVRANLGEAGKLLQADAAFQTGAVVARRVPLDATAARVNWDGRQLHADKILLRTGPSLALGSYSMDTSNLDFQFLLHGRLDPPNINGWFRDWWPRFFAQFEFLTAPPDASVEVAGRWGKPLETRVFVSAQARDVVVRDIAMQAMRTRLFVRPGWADVLHFVSDREVGTVEGSFARQWRLPDSRRWTRIEVDAGGVSDLSPTPKLLTTTGESIIEPFEFENPLKLSLQGQISREDLGAPVSQDFLVYASYGGPWQFHGFPLEDLDLTARHEGDLTRIPGLTAKLAQGELTGRLELDGPADNRQMAFDLNLEDASLDEAIRDVSGWLAVRDGETPSSESEFSEQAAEGRLTVSLSAEGPSGDALALQGAGSAAITDANLANINMLGVLSALLQRTILNFSTLQLNHAHTNFQLEGPKLVFPEFKITGRRGAVDAVGEYSIADRQLDFNTKVRPFEGGEGLLDAVFSPLSSVLEVKLAGELTDPEWTFVYGPTNLLRNLTGENNRNRPAQANETSPTEGAATPAPETPPEQDPPTVE